MMAYAHSRPACPESEWEPLERHLAEVADLAGCFGEFFRADAYARLAGLWHDLGKYSAEFQEYLRWTTDGDAASEHLRGRVDHSTAGAQHAARTLTSPANRLIAYCIAGHHAGLPDWISDSEACLSARLVKTVPRPCPPDELLVQPSPPLPDMKWTEEVAERSFQAAVFGRMVFSCLVDADFLATERFLNPTQSDFRSTYPSVPEIESAVHAHLDGLRRDAQRTAVNAAREVVLDACLNAATWSPGLFSLTVPTGGGKTLSSLAFALSHAVRYGLRRIIYAAPFTSIIEQNANVYRRAVGSTKARAVLEHHSAADIHAQTLHPRLAAENWDAPLVVTTNVQLFESLFAASPSRCRKLHRVAGSVIVLDEVQSLPVRVLKPTLWLLRELVRNYRCSVVLCSATQPAVQRREEFDIGLEGVREMVPDVPRLFTTLKRTSIESIGSVRDDDLVARFHEDEQVLCIVNTKRHAWKLFGLARENGASFHLSASMCPAHRSAVLLQVKERLNRRERCILISTQVVEAGVDIDFPVVYRAITGIDSIAQAAGRCNREGRLSIGRVVIFDPEDPIPAGELRRAADTGRELMTGDDDVLSPTTIDRYFTLHYWKRQADWDRDDVLGCFKPGGELDLRQAAARYRLVSQEQRPICIPWDDEGRRLCNRIVGGEPPNRALYRALQRYVVLVYPKTYEGFVQSGAVLCRDDGPAVLVQERLYDPSTGLRPINLSASVWDPDELIV